MKCFTIKDHPRDGEFIVGPTVVGSRTTYLVYNEVAPGQTVPLRAGHGHEEIFLVMAGSGKLSLGGEESSSRDGAGGVPRGGPGRDGDGGGGGDPALRLRRRPRPGWASSLAGTQIRA